MDFRLRQRVAAALRASLRCSCSIVHGKKMEAVEEPISVPHRRHHEEVVLSRAHPSRPTPTLPSRLRMQRRGNMPRGHAPPPHCGGPVSGAMMRRLPEKIRNAGGAPQRNEKSFTRSSSLSSFSYYICEQIRSKSEGDRGHRKIATRDMAGERMKKKLLRSNSYRFTSSSSDGSRSDGELRFESDETAPLFSSRSFSSDSSEFYYSSSCRCSRSRRKKNPLPRHRRQRKPREELGEESGRRCGPWAEGVRPLVSMSPSAAAAAAAAHPSRTAKTYKKGMAMEVRTDDEKMGTVFAVKKRSSDPREDFRSSMLEMMMEKQVFGDRDLEELLHCYLSLNHPLHHPLILEVFSEIQETLFG